uniref:Uncharacterized protein n=1 Tax=Arundo donax TaxID=35708 RepID=A0A0A9HN90_ARUDO
MWNKGKLIIGPPMRITLKELLLPPVMGFWTLICTFLRFKAASPQNLNWNSTWMNPSLHASKSLIF